MENLYRAESVARNQEERRAAAFRRCPEGFLFESEGRSGHIYFRDGERMADFYWEMPGDTVNYDILLWIEMDDGMFWTYPKKEKVLPEERSTILDAFERWLKEQKIRSDAFAPIKRDYFRKK